MIQKPQTHMHPPEDVALSSDTMQLNMVSEGNEVMAPLGNMKQQILAATYWFDPEPHPTPYSVTVRFSGHRVDVMEQSLAGNQFVQDETVERVVPGSGPISVTARIRNINAGEWVVAAHVLEELQHSPCESRILQKPLSAAAIQAPMMRFWYRWSPTAGEVEPVKTCLLPFARIPGILHGIWGVMVMLGIAIALVLQSLVIDKIHLAVSSAWMISLVAVAVGIVGSKVWYIVVYRRMIGWCIQGFITGASLMIILLLVLLHVPVGAFLDATAPGLLIAMAVGRVGCFFGGCCGGPPTASRWGMWSSDQRVGVRRIPTQLMEMALAGILGLSMLAVILSHGTRSGSFFFGGLAAYTLVRQGILYLRAEQYKKMLGRRITVALAALIVIVAVLWLAR